MVATKIQVSFAEQCLIPFTSVLQVHKTVVVVCCVSKQNRQISSTWEEYKCVNVMIYAQETCLNVILNALEDTTLAYALVTDKSYQFYEPRKC